MTNTTKILIEIILFSVAILSAVLFGGKIQYNNLSLEYPVPGTILVKNNGKPDKASLLVSASDIWIDTGLDLLPNGEINITATGKATLAIHRLVESAQEDTIPNHGWVGPEGGIPDSKTRSFRRSLLVEPNAEEGSLLAWFSKNGDVKPSKINPRPSEGGRLIQFVGNNSTLKNENNYPVRLWLTLNDAVLDSEKTSETAYKENKNGKKINSKWDYIKAHNYWNVWYDDNVGFYQIQVQYNYPDG
jgi:hypothetical protein